MSNKKYRFYLIKSTFFLFIEERLPTTNICFYVNHFLYFNRITVAWNHITFHIIYHIVILEYVYQTLKNIFTSCLLLKLFIWSLILNGSLVLKIELIFFWDRWTEGNFIDQERPLSWSCTSDGAGGFRFSLPDLVMLL